MIERLKYCIYILLAKQYAVYTADKYKFGKFGSCHIKAWNKAFLTAIIEYTQKINEQIKEKTL